MAQPATSFYAVTIATKTWPAFLQETPPDTPVLVVDTITKRWTSGSHSVVQVEPRVYFVIPPTDIQLYCSNQICGDNRTFSFGCSSGEIIIGRNDAFVVYVCRNCQESSRTFAIAFGAPTAAAAVTVVATKYGERPPYGPPVPAGVIALIGPDRELFLKGRRAEVRGLGIGAFAYYRRVVENQTQRVFGQLRKAAESLHDVEAAALLERAANETQFTRAVGLVKDALPRRLWIHNENPLTLLHNATSNDLHAGTDEECLEVATSIRTVLTELVARVNEVTKEDEALRKAVATLANRPKK